VLDDKRLDVTKMMRVLARRWWGKGGLCVTACLTD